MKYKNVTISTGPGVCIFFRGNTILYVGATAHGLNYLNSHRMRKLLRDNAVDLEFISMDTPVEAFDLETSLIEECQPELNMTGTDMRRRYRARLRTERSMSGRHEQVRVHWQPSEILIDSVNSPVRLISSKSERRLLERIYLKDLRRQWPNAKIVDYEGYPVIYCGEQDGEQIYYNRHSDMFVLSAKDAIKDP